MTILPWLFTAGLVILVAFGVRYTFSSDRRAEGLPHPPSVYENVGALDDFPLGASRLRDDVWIVRSEEAITAIVDDPKCPYSIEGDGLVDCRGRDPLRVHPTGPGVGTATGPFIEDLPKLCVWIYPPQGDVWIYFEPWPARAGGGGCPR